MLEICREDLLRVEPFCWELGMGPNFDLALAPIFHRIAADPTVKPVDEGPPKGESTVFFQYGKSA